MVRGSSTGDRRKLAVMEPGPADRAHEIELERLREIALSAHGSEHRRRAIRAIGRRDEHFLVRLTLLEPDAEVAACALALVGSQAGLAQIAASANVALRLRLAAIERLRDEQILCHLACSATRKAIRDAAGARITDPRLQQLVADRRKRQSEDTTYRVRLTRTRR